MAPAPCRGSVSGFGPCELDAGHHGPCAHGYARAWTVHCCAPLSGCAACDRLDADEVLRLDAGGELRPLQVAPTWLKNVSFRPRMVSWALCVLAGGRP